MANLILKDNGELWQGSAVDVELLQPGEFDIVVLCAEEFQPSLGNLNSKILKLPFPDFIPRTKKEDKDFILFLEQVIIPAARKTAMAVLAGDKVLITCFQGLNRSSLVTGIVLGIMMPKLQNKDVVDLIKEKRPGALGNEYFEDILLRRIYF